MPLYSYKCEDCFYNNRVYHAFSIKIEECPKCGSKNFDKDIPSFSIKQETEKDKVKQRVQKGIDDAKEEMRKDVLQRKADRKK